jgi:hypothetical protein
MPQPTLPSFQIRENPPVFPEYTVEVRRWQKKRKRKRAFELESARQNLFQIPDGEIPRDDGDLH